MYIAWKLLGFLSNKGIGSGTNLDSLHFQFLLAEHLEVNAQDVQVGKELIEAVVSGELEQDVRNVEVDDEMVGPTDEEVKAEGR
ncbi:unnamed protein product [Musa acuminata subsp. burmannicoides]